MLFFYPQHILENKWSNILVCEHFVVFSHQLNWNIAIHLYLSASDWIIYPETVFSWCEVNDHFFVQNVIVVTMEVMVRTQIEITIIVSDNLLSIYYCDGWGRMLMVKEIWLKSSTVTVHCWEHFILLHNSSPNTVSLYAACR